jgi:signal transduction histidine kinase
MAATEGHGMGLANIRRRLTMLYGDSAVLSLARAATRGVVATVAIPLPRPHVSASHVARHDLATDLVHASDRSRWR